MGGSGSGGYVPSTPASPCGQLVFQAAINSPNPSIVSRLSVGAILNLVATSNAQSIVAGFDGQVAGVITGAQVSQLANCIASGFEYQAIVVQLTGGYCVVRVQPS